MCDRSRPGVHTALCPTGIRRKGGRFLGYETAASDRACGFAFTFPLHCTAVPLDRFREVTFDKVPQGAFVHPEPPGQRFQAPGRRAV